MVWNMLNPIYISIAALAVSIVSVVVSIYSSVRDRGRLKTGSVLYASHEGAFEPAIHIEAVNVGRRPLIIRMWGGSDDKGEYAGTPIEEDSGGKRLGEHERVEFVLHRGNLGFFYDGNTVDFTELWFEDTLGRRYMIKKSRDNIKGCNQAWVEFRKKVEATNNMRKIIRDEVLATLSPERDD